MPLNKHCWGHWKQGQCLVLCLVPSVDSFTGFGMELGFREMTQYTPRLHSEKQEDAKLEPKPQ